MKQSTEQIRQTLRMLGAKTTYAGYPQAVIALELVLEDENRMRAITTEVYAEVGRRTGSNGRAVERNMRTLIEHICSVNRKGLNAVAGRELETMPTVSEFLDILLGYMQRNGVNMD